MGFLHYAYKTTVRQRKMISVLVVAFALTSSNVQAAEISTIAAHGQQVDQETATMTLPDGLVLPPAYFDQTTSSTSGTTTQPPQRVARTPLSAASPFVGSSAATTTVQVTITAYSSAPNQTDGSPFVTASGACVGDGVVAANFLPFGTKLQLPGLFGDKVFEVLDRMNERFDYRIDVWMKSRPEALTLGVKRNARVVIVEKGNNANQWGKAKSDGDCQKVAAESVVAVK